MRIYGEIKAVDGSPAMGLVDVVAAIRRSRGESIDMAPHLPGVPGSDERIEALAKRAEIGRDLFSE